jgi:lysophospholipase L1-like esterase
MSNHHVLHPFVTELEGRALLSAAVPLPAGLVALAAVSTPGPGNFISPAAWMSYHNEFVIRAAWYRDPVVFLGDSITNLWTDAYWTPLTSYARSQFVPPVGSATWSATFGRIGAVNFGIPGDQTHNLVWRVLNGELRGQPKVVVLQIGTNDLNLGKTPQQTADGILAVVQAIRAVSPGTKILCVGLLAGGTLARADVLTTNWIVAQQAWRYGATFVDVGPYVTPHVDACNHPTAVGYSILAYAIAGPLGKILWGR